MPDTPWSTVTINDSEVTLSDNANMTGEMAEIIDIAVPHGYRYTFPSEPRNGGVQLFVMAHETVSAPTGSNSISLSNNLVDSPAVSDILSGTGNSETATTGASSLVVYDDDSGVATQTGVESVDYAANSFTYDNSTGSASDLEVYYLTGDASEVEFRYYDKSDQDYDEVYADSLNHFHQAEVFNKNGQISFGKRFTAEAKEHVRVYVNTSVDLTNWDALDAGDGPGTNVNTKSYSWFQFPVRKQRA